MKKEEHVVANGTRSIYGNLFYSTDAEKKGVVILSHGYNGIGDDFDFECTTFARNGYVAFAYDFCGGSVRSRSKGLKTTEMKISTEKEDLLAVVEDISSLEVAKDLPIYLFGGSQGGFVTSLVLDELQDKVRAAALYYPALNIPEDWRRNYKSVEDIPEITDLMDMKLGRAFFEEIRDFYTFEHIGTFKNPIMIVYGDQDALVPRSVIDQAIETFEKSELVILEGEGHGFTPKGCEMAMKHIIEFFEK